MEQGKVYITQAELDRATKERTQFLENVKKPEIYRDNLDQLTIRMARKKELGTWTKEDSEDYLIAYEKCTELIKQEEAKIVPDYVEVVTDSEYEKLLALEEAKKAKLEEELNGTDSNTADTADTADTTEENIER